MGCSVEITARDVLQYLTSFIFFILHTLWCHGPIVSDLLSVVFVLFSTSRAYTPAKASCSASFSGRGGSPRRARPAPFGQHHERARCALHLRCWQLPSQPCPRCALPGEQVCRPGPMPPQRIPAANCPQAADSQASRVAEAFAAIRNFARSFSRSRCPDRR